jgi:PPK2 family polyphosphate:nucleotide phosphotransferase
MRDAPFEAPASRYLVPDDGSFRIRSACTEPPGDAPDKKANQAALAAAISSLDALQHKLYADNRHALLLVFQAMDAAGKDGTIRAVMSGVNPAGCQVYAFKAPSPEELDHDFLWRVQRALPERGRIGIWNRSHYEEVLTVKVNPKLLDTQRLPRRPPLDDLWDERYESIRDAELHWARNGIVVLKFFLHVSKQEQKKRLLERIDEAEDNWKFNAEDLKVRKQWSTYMSAYEDALNATSRPWAPWYAIPADSKSYMRRTVADIVVGTLKRLKLAYPESPADERAEFEALRAELERE